MKTPPDQPDSQPALSSDLSLTLLFESQLAQLARAAAFLERHATMWMATVTCKKIVQRREEFKIHRVKEAAVHKTKVTTVYLADNGDIEFQLVRT